MTEKPPQPRHDYDNHATELHGSPPGSQHASDDVHDGRKGQEPAVQSPSDSTAGGKLNNSQRDDGENGSDAEEVDEGEDDDDDDDEDDEDEDDDEGDDGEDEEDEEPLLKYARLTQHLSAVYRNGDATSAFLVAGDKMVCHHPLQCLPSAFFNCVLP